MHIYIYTDYYTTNYSNYTASLKSHQSPNLNIYAIKYTILVILQITYTAHLSTYLPALRFHAALTNTDIDTDIDLLHDTALH